MYTFQRRAVISEKPDICTLKIYEKRSCRLVVVTEVVECVKVWKFGDKINSRTRICLSVYTVWVSLGKKNKNKLVYSRHKLYNEEYYSQRSTWDVMFAINTRGIGNVSSIGITSINIARTEKTGER